MFSLQTFIELCGQIFGNKFDSLPEKFFPTLLWLTPEVRFWLEIIEQCRNLNTISMSTNLVIVESPAKAKTIEGFLGKDFTVKSSFGHIRDLPEKALGIEIDKGFIPNYVVPSDKRATLNDLKALAKNAQMVWLATDEDREGEAISWHLAQSLELTEDKYNRIAFHEITKKAVIDAIANPRKINQGLVDAQQARRVLDRLVGFELSPLLWRKVKPALSAGRVQSVAVRLIVEREKEIGQFNTSGYFKVVATLNPENQGLSLLLKAELPRKVGTIEEATTLLKKCIGAKFSVANTETKPAKKSPAPPFTTSTLQQEASRKLGFSVARTMSVAQKLYESGKITYMRTDSLTLSSSAMKMAKDEIEKNYGPEYSKPRKFQTKTKGAQEAHEAIRPVYMNESEIDGDIAQQKLYNLIWKRTIASQMSDAVLEKTTVNIDVSSLSEQFVAQGEVVKFEGFLKLYIESTDDESEESVEGLLPVLAAGQRLGLVGMNATQRFTIPPPRYTEASLVRKLEELGIGRPSTYAPTISTIQKREYVVKENREGMKREYLNLKIKDKNVTEEKKIEKHGQEKNKLFPTDIGGVVNSFLVEYFDGIIDYNFTANVEKEFDEIAMGKKDWKKVIKEFYLPFHDKVENTMKTSERFSGERLLGQDPKSGKNVYAKIGRFGPMIQIGNADDVTKPRFASILKSQSLETITLEQALELFKLPRIVGVLYHKEVVASVGRFGPYVRFEGKFVSIPKGFDPLTISLDEAMVLIKEKQDSAEKTTLREFSERPDIKILTGRYGPYLTSGKDNYKLPKTKNPLEFSLKDCIEIIKNETPTNKTRKSKKK